MSANIFLQSLFAARRNITLNAKGADAFISTTNPILDLFTETRKKVPETLDEFKTLVRKIETAKNYNSEMFVKLLKFHRLIEKGNGMKGVYYICMMVLKESDPVMYENIIKWSHEYPKDILRLARLSSMFGGICATPVSTGSSVILEMTKNYGSASSSKGELGTKMTKWLLTEKKSGNVITSKIKSKQTVAISAEIELYAQLVAETIKQILTGKLYDEDVNLMLFKYLSYETGHFAVESKVIWKTVENLLENDPVILAAFDEYTTA